MWVHIDVISILLFIVIGLVAGWLAGLVFRGRGFGLIGNLIVGGIGAIVGGILFNLIGVYFYGLVGNLISAFVGAVIFVLIIILIKRA